MLLPGFASLFLLERCVEKEAQEFKGKEGFLQAPACGLLQLRNGVGFDKEYQLLPAGKLGNSDVKNKARGALVLPPPKSHQLLASLSTFEAQKFLLRRQRRRQQPKSQGSRRLP